MPSGLSNRSDNSDAILTQILAGVKKLPGNALGAPVDLVNSALNVAKAAYGYAGSKVGILGADDLPELIENPIGGSQWINSKFGNGKSTGLADDLTQFAGGFISPENGVLAAGKLGVALKSVILPAALLHDSSTVTAAGRLLSKGVPADRVYDLTGIFPSEDNSGGQILKSVLPDSGASLKTIGGVLRNSQGNITVSPLAMNLGDVLDHPDLFKAMPDLANTPIIASGSVGGGSFNTGSKVIKIGDYPDEQSFMSTVLHETQHAIQDRSGFTGGSSPGYFVRNQGALNLATNAAEVDTSFAGSKNRGILRDAQATAMDNYMNTAGEQEARIVQQQFTSGDYSVSPAATTARLKEGGDIPIHDLAAVPKVDDDPKVKALVDYYNNPQSGP